MLRQKPSLIIQISLGTAIFDCRLYSNWQVNVYLTLSVKLSLVNFIINIVIAH